MLNLELWVASCFWVCEFAFLVRFLADSKNANCLRGCLSPILGMIGSDIAWQAWFKSKNYETLRVKRFIPTTKLSRRTTTHWSAKRPILGIKSWENPTLITEPTLPSSLTWSPGQSYSSVLQSLRTRLEQFPINWFPPYHSSELCWQQKTLMAIASWGKKRYFFTRSLLCRVIEDAREEMENDRVSLMGRQNNENEWPQG